MKIKLSQKTADKLMELYREMDLVPLAKFNQNDCEKCVIGHAMHHGILNGFHTEDDFDNAVKWVGLPSMKPLENKHTNIMVFEYGVLGDYLFGTTWGSYQAANVLDFPVSNHYTPKGAQKRIKSVLEAAGYEVVWNR